MTRADVIDWLQEYGCNPEPTESLNATANVIYFFNPSNRRHAYLTTPIDDTIMRPHAVKSICLSLGVPLPEYALQEE